MSRVTFTDPEIGAVGLTEQQARDAGLDVTLGVTPLGETTRGWIHGTAATASSSSWPTRHAASSSGRPPWVRTQERSWAHSPWPCMREVPVETLRTMIYAYPTFHRGIETALGELDRPG